MYYTVGANWKRKTKVWGETVTKKGPYEGLVNESVFRDTFRDEHPWLDSVSQCSRRSSRRKTICHKTLILSNETY